MDFPIPQPLLEQFKVARAITVLTGAGISAESGVPTFRDSQQGLWSRYRPEELATPSAFERNPRLVWEWYAWRRGLVSAVEPNAGHRALAEMEAIFQNFTLVTQNVDGLHQRAGSGNVVEIHGNILRTRCSREGSLVSAWHDSEDVPPKCPQCGGLLRPDVVWFEETLPQMQWEKAMKASANAEVFLSVGTSALVFPAAGLPLQALQNGAILIEINPEPTPLTPSAQYVFSGPAGIVLPSLVAGLKTLLNREP